MARRCPCTSARFRFTDRSKRSTRAEAGTDRTSSRGRPPQAIRDDGRGRVLVRDLYLTGLRAVLIVDDKDIEAVLSMLHYIRGDNQDVGSDAGPLPGVDEIALSLRQWPRTGAFAGAARRISRCRQLSRPPRTDTAWEP